MVNLKESAMAYEPPQTLNIADLDSININELEVKNGEGTDKEGQKFEYKYTEIDGKQYRIPGSVLHGIKNLIQKMPQLTQVSVLKSGSGMNTTYQVIPTVIQDQKQ